MATLKYYDTATSEWKTLIVGAKGEQGDVGPANTLEVGTVTDSAPGSEPEVTITGTAPNQTINFVLPTGDAGPQGETGEVGATGNQGPSGVVSVTAPITNSGTSTSANIGIDLSSYYTSSQVDSAIASVVDSAPSTLNTLNELAAALNDDENFASTITTALGEKAPINNPVFTGTVTGTPKTPNQADNKSSSQIGYIGVPFSTAATTGSYTVSYNDAGRLIHSTSSRTITLGDYFMGETIEPGTTVVFSTASGATVTFVPLAPGLLVRVGDGATGNRTLTPFGLATAIFISESVGWYISGNGLS